MQTLMMGNCGMHACVLACMRFKREVVRAVCDRGGCDSGAQRWGQAGGRVAQVAHVPRPVPRNIPFPGEPAPATSKNGQFAFSI